MWTFRLVAHHLVADPTLERTPTVRVYASPETVTVTTTTVDDDTVDDDTVDRAVQHVHVTVPSSTTPTWPTRAVFGVDLYTSTLNADRRPCRVRAAYETWDLYDLLHQPVGTTVPGTLHNACRRRTAANQGRVTLTVVTSSPSPCPRRNRPLDHAAFHHGTAQSLTHLARLTPSHPSLEHMLAPVFQSRTAAVPGIGFWRRPPLRISESAAVHVLDVVLARHQHVDRAPFAAWSITDAAVVLADFCSCYPASCPYMADVYPDHGRLCPYESFDDLFARGAGDCEDFSAAMVAVFHAVRFGDGRTWQVPALRHLVRVSTHYLAVSVLAAVTHPSYTAAADGGGIDRPWAAHMYTRYVPVTTWCRKAGLDSSSSTSTSTLLLPEFIGEGTAAVALAPASKGPVDTFATRLRTGGLPPGYDVVSTPVWGDPHGFYRRDVHAYTPYFWARDGHDTSVTVPWFFSFVHASQPHVYGTTFGDAAYALHVHPGMDADARHRLDDAMALEAPSPPWTAPGPVTSTAAMTWPGAATATAAETTLPDHTRRAVVVCSTPDATARTVFDTIVAREGAYVHVAAVETFCAGAPPQVRLDVRVREEKKV